MNYFHQFVIKNYKYTSFFKFHRFLKFYKISIYKPHLCCIYFYLNNLNENYKIKHILSSLYQKNQPKTMKRELLRNNCFINDDHGTFTYLVQST